MSGTIPTDQELEYFISQLASARAALTPAKAAFDSAQAGRDAAQQALASVQASALAQFNGLIAGTVNPTAQDLENSINAIQTAQRTLENAQIGFVVAQSTLTPLQAAFDTLVANARIQFAQIFGT